MSFITDLFSGSANAIGDPAGNVSYNATITNEEKMILDNEIKKADRQFQLEAARLGLEEIKLDNADRDSARVSQTAVQTSATATTLSKNIGPFLAILGTALCFGMFYMLVFNSKVITENGDKQILTYILGVLSGLLMQVYGYYFGSSSGSAEKNRTMSHMLESQNAGQNK